MSKLNPNPDRTNTSRVLEKFVSPPARDVREQYTYRLAEKPEEAGKGWPRCRVIVEERHEDGTVEDIYTYDRNYSMMRTFEPFRQLHDGKWTDYALISSTYTRFEVLNLETRQIQATLPWPTVTQEHHDRWRKMGYDDWCEKEPVGTEKPGHGFCPVDFYVPDLLEDYYADAAYTVSSREGEETSWLWDEEELLGRTGQFAFYIGCHWGDDSSWKMRHIDLSRLHEGIVTEDDRYGYLEYGGTGALKDNLDYWGPTSMNVPTLVRVNPQTGKSFKLDLNWLEAEEE